MKKRNTEKGGLGVEVEIDIKITGVCEEDVKELTEK